AEAEARGYLLATGYERADGGVASYRQGQRHLDFSNPAARDWWWSAHRGLVSLGVGGWWLDGGEGPPASAKLAAGDGRRLHNIYDRFRHQAFAEGEAAARPEPRWFLLGAFSPIFRSHGWVWREHVPWAHGPEVEAICRRFAELRYRLLPYTYTLAWQAHTLGLPLMRPLVLNYPNDPRTWALDHEYLWGDDLLVAPVTREGASAWPVYLPSGRWFAFGTGSRCEGPGGVTLAAPLERLPLLVRGGAILPLGPVVQHTGERPLDELTLQIYPEGTSRFELYEDDGR